MNNCLPVALEIKDEDKSRIKYINNDYIVDLVAFIINNSDFIVYFNDIIYNCYSFEELKESEELARFTTENMSERNKDLKNFEFLELIFDFYLHFTEINQIGNARGALLERLTLLLICERYIQSEKDIYLPIENEDLFENCVIGIDCKIHIVHRNWTTKDPIDIVGWNKDQKFGETYECKIKFRKIQKSDAKILSSLKEMISKSEGIDDFLVGIITLDSKSAIANQLNFIDYGFDFENSGVEFFGREDFHRVENYFSNN